MQPDPHLLQDSTREVVKATVVVDAGEHAALLRLLDNCVTAMHLLDKRMTDLETKARYGVEESHRARAETRADIAALRTRTKLTDGTIDQLGTRLAASEAGIRDATAKSARDMNTVRSTAESWRASAEIAIARLTSLEQRLSGVEAGLESRLSGTEATLNQAQAKPAHLEDRATASEAVASDMQGRFINAVSAVNDQRARVACLQAKLAATAEAARYAEASTLLTEGAAKPPVPTIIDLALITEERRAFAG